ncbi:MAG: MEDS domain-containing protein [Caenispirillum bisanense]|nr:MEDS domain-containing protein [Caenispirillum bisanense]MCA1972622.1 MEDS domain-containing protein [Caenispirillum sp.]
MTDQASFDLGSIQPGTHVCFIYDSVDQRLDALGRIMAGVLRGGGSTTYFACDTDLDVIRDHLTQRGVPVDLLAEPTFGVKPARSVYTPGGRFDKEHMLQQLRDGYDRGRAQVGGTVFFTGEMEWALAPDLPGRDQLVAYEQAVNTVIRTHPFSAICQYDAAAFDGELLFEIVKAHPLMLVRNQILANPYYAGAPEAANSDDACPCGETHGRDHAHA